MSIEYKEIKSAIQDISTSLTSIVSIDVNDYTHQPSNTDISYKIDETIVELKKLRRKIDY